MFVWVGSFIIII